MTRSLRSPGPWLAGCVLALAGTALQAQVRTLDGTVTRVSDGDTLWLRPAPSAHEPRPRPVKLRLLGLDAPERCQAWGAEATAALKARVLKRRVTAERRATDDYGRGLVVLRLDGEDVGAWLVAQGHAWSYGRRPATGIYAAQELQARAARRGLFADARAIEPRVFRRQHGPCDARPAGR